MSRAELGGGTQSHNPETMTGAEIKSQALNQAIQAPPDLFLSGSFTGKTLAWRLYLWESNISDKRQFKSFNNHNITENNRAQLLEVKVQIFKVYGQRSSQSKNAVLVLSYVIKISADKLCVGVKSSQDLECAMI